MAILTSGTVMRSAVIESEVTGETPLVRWKRERTLGTFTISDKMIHDQPHLARLIVASVFILRAEQRWDVSGIEYTALGEDFDPVPKYQNAPIYIAVVEHEDERIDSFHWQRQDR